MAYLSFLGTSVPAKYILLGVKYRNKNSFKNIRTDAKIRIFPIPVAYWSGFAIFKQNQENPDKVTMKMTTTQVVEMSVTVDNNSPIQDYVVHPRPVTRGGARGAFAPPPPPQAPKVRILILNI